MQTDCDLWFPYTGNCVRCWLQSKQTRRACISSILCSQCHDKRQLYADWVPTITCSSIIYRLSLSCFASKSTSLYLSHNSEPNTGSHDANENQIWNTFSDVLIAPSTVGETRSISIQSTGAIFTVAAYRNVCLISCYPALFATSVDLSHAACCSRKYDSQAYRICLIGIYTGKRSLYFQNLYHLEPQVLSSSSKFLSK